MANSSEILSADEVTNSPEDDSLLFGASEITGLLTAEAVRALEVSGAMLGIITNLKVIIVISLNSAMLKSRTNMFIVWQSVVDALTGMFNILVTQVSLRGKFYDGKSPSDVLLCTLWATRLPIFTFAGASAFNMVVMTTERYLAVVKPIWHKIHISNKIVYISMPLSFLYGFAYQGSLKLPSTKIIDGSCRSNQWPDMITKRAMAMASPVAIYILPVTIVIITYAHMAYKLRKGIGGAGSELSSGAARARKNVIVTMVLIIAGYIICWTPSQTQFLLFNLGFKINQNSDVYRLSRVLALLNCTINPFIYMAKYKPYQTAMRKCIWKMSCGKFGPAKVEDISNGTSSIIAS